MQVKTWGAGEDVGCRQKMSPLLTQMALEPPKPSGGSVDTGQSHVLSDPDRPFILYLAHDGSGRGCLPLPRSPPPNLPAPLSSRGDPQSGHITLPGLLLHQLSLSGGGVGGTTDILLPRKSTGMRWVTNKVRGSYKHTGSIPSSKSSLYLWCFVFGFTSLFFRRTPHGPAAR